ncbi:MAG: class II aldolase/adducin family protein, partial [Polyangiaceae bacterium]
MIDPRSELALLGKELGGFRWAQGPGGNVSIKSEGELWVKASGKRLTDVALEGGHVRVRLDVGRAALAGTKGAEEALFSGSPRPSLETYFHVLGPAVVCHTHALGALLLACSSKKFEHGGGPA